MHGAETDSIVVTHRFAAPPDAVWKALTVTRAGWWPELEFEPHHGARLVETWQVAGRTASTHGTVTEIDPPTRLAFEWVETDWAAPLTVVLTLVPAAGGTQVTVEEHGFRAALVGGDTEPESLAAEHAAGWSHHLGRWEEASSGHPLD